MYTPGSRKERVRWTRLKEIQRPWGFIVVRSGQRCRIKWWGEVRAGSSMLKSQSDWMTGWVGSEVDKLTPLAVKLNFNLT